ncbi:endolytic transglycosylase MltG [Sciscionella marina]|uniref:endolytic transglycosylase MltG n=1 Tax=Sciscionella marina TaxID=508770 RepID=UPI0003828B28|nr:endolytic transglycosylase MltG [Sciscionella marina]
MNDDLGLFDEDDYPRESPRSRGREQLRRKRRITWLGSGVIVAVLLLFAWFGVRQLLGLSFADYEGGGQGQVVVQVTAGQSQRAIASELAEKDVVASASAYTHAAEDNDKALSVQPGYYQMHAKMSGQAAVARLTDPGSRVGNLQIRPGTRLQDVKQPNGSVTKGVLTQLAESSCAEHNGDSTCVSANTLQQVVGSTDLTSLGVPSWAAKEAGKVDAAHRLEGLILPGVYEVKPGASAKDLLSTVLRASAEKMSSAGLPQGAEGSGLSAYQVLTVASLVQGEGLEKDFGKVSRVIHNRLTQKQRLELDSTVNYVLDRPEIRTSKADRDKAGPYNTYANTDLPPSPIDSPSIEAIKAAAKPTPGDWLFFVKCEKDGSSCFAKTVDEHRQNAKKAQESGVY